MESISTDPLLSLVGKCAHAISTSLYRVGVLGVGYSKLQLAAALLQADSRVSISSMNAGTTSAEEMERLKVSTSFLGKMPVFIGDDQVLPMSISIQNDDLDVMIIVRKLRS